MMYLRTSLVAGAAAVVLAACGGGGGGDTPAQADPLDALPTEATQSVSAWIGFLTSLTKAAGAEMREGFEISSTGVNGVPVDDTGEPSTLTP
jgi:ABC-type glycerol-3-phosphate transport system substrate-binding protein